MSLSILLLSNTPKSVGVSRVACGEECLRRVVGLMLGESPEKGRSEGYKGMFVLVTVSFVTFLFPRGLLVGGTDSTPLLTVSHTPILGVPRHLGGPSLRGLWGGKVRVRVSDGVSGTSRPRSSSRVSGFRMSRTRPELRDVVLLFLVPPPSPTPLTLSFTSHPFLVCLEGSDRMLTLENPFTPLRKIRL